MEERSIPCKDQSLKEALGTAFWGPYGWLPLYSAPVPNQQLASVHSCVKNRNTMSRHPLEIPGSMCLHVYIYIYVFILSMYMYIYVSTCKCMYFEYLCMYVHTCVPPGHKLTAQVTLLRKAVAGFAAAQASRSQRGTSEEQAAQQLQTGWFSEFQVSGLRF